MRAPADGYTLSFGNWPTHVLNGAVYNLSYDVLNDFDPLAQLVNETMLIVAKKAMPAKDLKEFIAHAKSKPGALNYASSGPGTPYHMAGELFKSMSGTDILHVPHKASGEMRSSVIGGHVNMIGR